MVEKPEVLYGEIQGVVGYWYPEMDMDLWLKPILENSELWEQYAIYDNEKEEEILVSDLIIAYEKLEAIKLAYKRLRQNQGIFLLVELDKILETEGERASC